MIIYPGLIPQNVARDAKYSVVWGSGGKMEVRLIYRIGSSERVLLTTDTHDDLVEMVNEIKTVVSGSPGGVFYVNEFRDVVVPSSGDGYYAGNYPANLEFDFEGLTIGPRAPTGLQPGELWTGPHAGIRYVLMAGGSDIKYTKHDGNREFTHTLSDDIGPVGARGLAKRLSKVKGSDGGRIYINEALEFFSPVEGRDRIDYVYLGSLEEDLWFEPPDVPRPGD